MSSKHRFSMSIKDNLEVREWILTFSEEHIEAIVQEDDRVKVIINGFSNPEYNQKYGTGPRKTEKDPSEDGGE